MFIMIVALFCVFFVFFVSYVIVFFSVRVIHNAVTC